MKSHTVHGLCILLSLAAGLSTQGCKKEPPAAVYIPTLALTAVDASCTEAWLKLTTTQLPATVRLMRLTPTLQTLQTLQLTTPDTLLIDEGLLPNQTYTYKAYRLEVRGSVVDSSTQATVSTMDTTSHNFTWQIDTLGDGGGSALYDVAIINDTLAYAVGEIYKRDSVGNWDPNAYNLVKWNGQRWELKRIYTYSTCNPVDYAPLRAIWAFSDSSILVTSGGSLGRYNGRVNTPDCSIRPLVNGSINKIWAYSENDVYVVGNNGFIAHYDGVRWRRIESGTNVDLLDVYGTPDGAVVWACGYHDAQPGTYLLRYRGSGWEMAYDGTQSEFIIRSDSLSGAFTSVYTDGNKRIYVASSAGVYMAPWSTRGEAKRLSFTPTWFPGFPQRIRGAEARDWFVIGAFNFIAHYNGSTWRHYSELMHGDGRLRSVSQRGSFVVAVGYSYHPIHSRAIVFRGRR